ncbi:hypothetical protein Vadar_005994 [Vaccinium darrowii]|uniref:Uncharacterized protein n=1 Tax=Vaccinium darrowii TaxID=229202 RepID=A0ACB7WY13_9ERIC|nr:hypothetical protein Vadar_005994 [Vaccinium darrowii]
MSSSTLLFPLSLISFSLLLQLAFATNPIAWSCSNSANFTPNGTYNTNMNNLLSYLDSNTPLTGFSNGSIGQNLTQVYGLALCRGDINATACQACVDEASNEIQSICQFKEEAWVWYDYCEVRYSNLDFFGQIDNSEWNVEWNSNNVSDPVAFNQTLMELFTSLAEDASLSPILYAVGAETVNGTSENIYGLVQCTRDLSSVNCTSCINHAIRLIPQYFYGKTGGKAMGGSCNLHFEIYPFVLS